MYSSEKTDSGKKLDADFRAFLKERKASVLKKWFCTALESYPADSSTSLRGKDRFANPVGYILSHGMEGVLDALIEGGSRRDLDAAMEEMIKVKAVQDFSASEAVSFIFELKGVVRDEMAASRGALDIETLDRAVDALVLSAFDLFMRSREKIYDLKANEARNMTFRLLKMANLVCDIGETKDGDNGKSPQKER